MASSPWNIWFDGMARSAFGRAMLFLSGYTRKYYGTFAFNDIVTKTAGNVIIYVERTNGNYGAVTVDVVAVDGTAVRGVDYIVGATTTLSWLNADIIGKRLTIGINSSRTAKSFTLRLQNPTGYADIDSTYDEVVVTIPATIGPAGLLGIGGGIFTGGYLQTFIKESSTLVISVLRTRGATGAVGCSYHTTDGTAVDGVNYTGVSGTLSWANGETAAKTINIPILTVGASGTYFTLTIDTPTGDVMISSQYSSCRNYIYDIPALPGQLQFPNYQERAPESAAYTFTVYRVGGSTGAVSVNYSCANGTALNGTHYTAASGILNWADGDAASKTFNVTMLSVTDANRYFTITLATPGGGAAVGDIGTVVVYIQDAATVPTDIPSDVLVDPTGDLNDDDLAFFFSEDVFELFDIFMSAPDIHVIEANAISGDVIGFGGGTSSFGGGTDLISGDWTLEPSPAARFMLAEM
jgi:hypothetical protein